MWPFKSKEQKLDASQGELLKLLKEEKAIRDKQAKDMAAIQKAQEDERQKSRERKNEKIIKLKRSAIPHLESMQRYFTQLEATESDVQKAQIQLILTQKRDKVAACGVDIGINPGSVDSTLEKLRGR